MAPSFQLQTRGFISNVLPTYRAQYMRFLICTRALNILNRCDLILFQKLNAIQELQLLEMVCSCLQGAPQSSRFSIFSVIFGGNIEASKTTLLTKLVSMALSIGSGAVLDCAALWMQVIYNGKYK